MSMPLPRRGGIFGVGRNDETEAVTEADRAEVNRAADDGITTAVEGIIENTRKKVAHTRRAADDGITTAVQGIIENTQKKVAYTTTYGTS